MLLKEEQPKNMKELMKIENRITEIFKNSEVLKDKTKENTQNLEKKRQGDEWYDRSYKRISRSFQVI